MTIEDKAESPKKYINDDFLGQNGFMRKYFQLFLER